MYKYALYNKVICWKNGYIYYAGDTVLINIRSKHRGNNQNIEALKRTE